MLKGDEYKYVLITPARNEEAYIEMTIQSVISQTVLPEKWVIVSDGSTDHTDEIARRYCKEYEWIDFIRMPEHNDRHFAAKVRCFNVGLQKMRGLEYDIIGNLDADISFENDYFEFLLGKFSEITDLGVAGTPFVEDRYSSMRDSFEGSTHVAGQCQLFRRECFEEIGGYMSVRGGGVDWIAVITARMRGWKTWSFSEKHFFHYRRLGTAETNVLSAHFAYGKKDYSLGSHPLWELLRGMYRMTKRPLIMGGLLLMLGYFSAFLSRVARPVSRDFVEFHRKEQMQKLKTILGTIMKLQKLDKFNLVSQ